MLLLLLLLPLAAAFDLFKGHAALGPSDPIGANSRRFARRVRVADAAGGRVALDYDVTLREHTHALDALGAARVACPSETRLEIRWPSADAWREVQARVTEPGAFAVLFAVSWFCLSGSRLLCSRCMLGLNKTRAACVCFVFIFFFFFCLKIVLCVTPHFLNVIRFFIILIILHCMQLVETGAQLVAGSHWGCQAARGSPADAFGAYTDGSREADADAETEAEAKSESESTYDAHVYARVRRVLALYADGALLETEPFHLHEAFERADIHFVSTPASMDTLRERAMRRKRGLIDYPLQLDKHLEGDLFNFNYDNVAREGTAGFDFSFNFSFVFVGFSMMSFFFFFAS